MTLLAEAALRSSLLTAAVWLALKLFRISNPHTQMAAWSGVLLASLAMPLLMRWAPAETLPVPPDFYRGWTKAPLDALPAAAAPVQQAASSSGIFPLLLTAYLSVVSVLAVRLGFGLVQGLRLVRRSARVTADWAEGRDIRLSSEIAMPAAIGRTILLPVEFTGWDAMRRIAVLAHEASHVQRGDFYLLLLAALHRALFWFNPLSWWLNNRLADLAEANSDAAALAVAGDRLSYAGMLIDLAGAPRQAAAGLAMANHATVRRRVERILAESALPARLTLGKLALMAAGMIPAALAAAGATTVPVAENAVVKRQIAIRLNPAKLDRFVGYYALPAAPDLPVKVWREGDHLYASPLGQPQEEILPENDHLFFAKDVPEQGDFQSDAKGRVTKLVLHMNGGAWSAPRLDEAAGRALEKALAERIAVNRPQPGSEAALRLHIGQLQSGDLDDDTMVNGMGSAIRAMLPDIHPEMLGLGPITTVRFEGVGPDGMDVYLVTHANGQRRWRIRLTESGRIESMWFTPPI